MGYEMDYVNECLHFYSETLLCVCLYMYVSCVWILVTVRSRKNQVSLLSLCFQLWVFNLLFVPSGLSPHITNSGLVAHHRCLPHHLCVSCLNGLLSLNVCSCLFADLSLKMRWTGEKNISSQKHIEFRDYLASVFLCVYAGDGGMYTHSRFPHIYTMGSHPFPLFAHSNKSSL